MADTQNEINCPACGSPMKKVFISEKGINVDVCANGCGGIYFDNREIQEFSNINDDISEIKGVLANKNFIPVDEKQTRICPACGTPMAKTNAMGIQIDTCYKCGGIFLDNGEFEYVRAKFKKPKKVQPVELKPNSEFNLQEFYRDAQNEEYINERGYSTLSASKVNRAFRRISRGDFFGALFSLL